MYYECKKIQNDITSKYISKYTFMGVYVHTPNVYLQRSKVIQSMCITITHAFLNYTEHNIQNCPKELYIHMTSFG